MFFSQVSMKSIKLEFHFVWDCTDPYEITNQSNKTIVEMLTEKIKKFAGYNATFNLHLGPHINRHIKEKLLKLKKSYKFSNLNIKHISSTLDCNATLEAKPPQSNPGGSSDKWRFKIIMNLLESSNNNIIHIYTDLDNEINDPKSFIKTITTKLEGRGILFYGSERKPLYNTPYINLNGGNSVLIVSDVSKLKKIYEEVSKKTPQRTWVEYGNKLASNFINSVWSRMRHLLATEPEFWRTNTGLSYNIRRSTLFSAGALWFASFITAVLKNDKIEVHIKTEKNTCLYATNTTDFEKAKEYFFENGITINCAGTWCKVEVNHNYYVKSTTLLRNVQYKTPEKLQSDLIDRLVFEIRHFNEFNLPYTLLLSYKYQHLFKEKGFKSFLVSMLQKLEKRISFEKLQFKSCRIVDTNWLTKKLKVTLNEHWNDFEKNNTEITCIANLKKTLKDISDHKELINQTINQISQLNNQATLSLDSCFPPIGSRASYAGMTPGQ